jgi:uncharacterized cupredoxin-like copper-binding protein
MLPLCLTEVLAASQWIQLVGFLRVLTPERELMFNDWRQGILALAPMLLMLAAPACALADGTVNVTLEDASNGGNVTGMKMVAIPDKVKAGQVTIHATNKSLGLTHEVIVVRPAANDAPMPYDAAAGRVIEKRIKDLGEVSDLPPGKSGSLTVRLEPGDYLLICNQPNHYKAGMWTKLTVTQ